MTNQKTDSPEDEYGKAFKCERLILAYLRKRGECPYEELCAAFDPRETVGIDSILQEMSQEKLVRIVKGSVSITDSGLKWFEKEKER
jgi:hypothetical protein